MKRLNCVKIIVLVSLVLSAGCVSSSHSRKLSGEVTGPQQLEQAGFVNNQEAPGVVQYIWEEPMVDTVDVPPGLDPEGHYYRPAHQAVIEVRQGRWRYQKADK